MNTHRAFPIPEGLVKGPAVHVAIRRWAGATIANFRSLQSSGLDRDAHEPRLGLAAGVREMESSHLKIGPTTSLVQLARLLIEFVSAILILTLYLSQRARRTAYLLLGLSFLLEVAANIVGCVVAYSEWPRRGIVASLAVSAEYTAPLLLALFFGLSIEKRRWRWLAYFLAASSLARLPNGLMMFTQWTWWWSIREGIGSLDAIEAVIGLALAGVLVRERRAGSVILAVVFGVHSAVTAWFFQAGRGILVWGFVVVDVRDLSGLLLPLAGLVYVYLDYRDEQRRQLSVERDLLAAQRVQEMLLESGEAVAGFQVDKQYLPAREVGGDFYQLMPQPDGGLLMVAGDVSGKGLEAAMLAATMIGAVRASTASRPAEVLAHLNEAAMGRTRGGFVTCICALFGTDGRASLASAGQLPPYVGGRELVGEAGLPLGIASGVCYSEYEFRLEAGAQFTIVSDGVVEAANAKGELFGFERTREISMMSAQEISEAARAWGQNDDITVVTVRKATK